MTQQAPDPHRLSLLIGYRGEKEWYKPLPSPDGKQIVLVEILEVGVTPSADGQSLNIFGRIVNDDYEVTTLPGYLSPIVTMDHLNPSTLVYPKP